MRNNSDFNDDSYPMIISTNLKNKNQSGAEVNHSNNNQQITE